MTDRPRPAGIAVYPSWRERRAVRPQAPEPPPPPPPANTPPPIPVDPARAAGPHLVVDLPTGPVPLPGDVHAVVDPHGHNGLARVVCTDLIAKRLFLAVTWPSRLLRRVRGRALSAAVVDAGGSVHPAELAERVTEGATRG